MGATSTGDASDSLLSTIGYKARFHVSEGPQRSFIFSYGVNSDQAGHTMQRAVQFWAPHVLYDFGSISPPCVKWFCSGDDLSGLLGDTL